MLQYERARLLSNTCMLINLYLCKVLIIDYIPLLVGIRILRYIRDEQDISTPEENDIEYVLLDLGGKNNTTYTYISRLMVIFFIFCLLNYWSNNHNI